MQKQEFISKFLADLGIICFGALFLTQFTSEEPNVLLSIIGLVGTLGFFIISLVIYPKEK